MSNKHVTKKTILYVCGHDPREMSFGGPQRTHLLWKALQEIGDVYSVCYYPEEGKLDDRITAVRIVPPTGRHSLLNRVICRVWDWFDLEGKKILPVAASFSIPEPYPGVKFDAVVCRYCEPAVLFHLWNIAPLYIDVDDHPLQTFETRDRILLKRWQIPIASFLQRLEFYILEKHTTGGWIANPEQVSWCHFKKQAIPLKNIPQLPSSDYNMDAEREQYIFSIGFMQYQPNYMGVDSFIEEIWPTVHKEFPRLKYYIGGKNAPLDYVEKWKRISGVEYLGFVDDLEALYEQALATVVAVEQGGGTCIKTLESMAYGRVCLSRPFGLRGIECDGQNSNNGLHVFNSVKDFISLLNKYVLDKEERNKQEHAAALFVKEKYNKNVFIYNVKHMLE